MPRQVGERFVARVFPPPSEPVTPCRGSGPQIHSVDLRRDIEGWKFPNELVLNGSSSIGGNLSQGIFSLLNSPLVSEDSGG